MPKKDILILDSTAFYAGISSSGVSLYHITPHVLHEIKNTESSNLIISTLIESGKVIVIEPNHQLINEVKLMAYKIGDFTKLSDTDISIVALGVQFKRGGFKVTIISDDYSIQNLLNFFEIKFNPIMTRGISKIIQWYTYCNGCGKIFKNQNIKKCNVCGTSLKRKIKQINNIPNKNKKLT